MKVEHDADKHVVAHSVDQKDEVVQDKVLEDKVKLGSVHDDLQPSLQV